MFSFLQTILHKVTMVIATTAIAIGFISAPVPPKQPVLNNQNPVTVERQINKTAQNSYSVPIKHPTSQSTQNTASIQALTQQKKLSNKNIIAKVKPAVVYLETNEAVGSGMIIGKDGLILTNAHVVNGINSLSVKLSDGRIFTGKVIGRDENVDLAIVSIDGSNLPVVEFGDSNYVEQGDSVFTLGYPFGLEGDVSFKEGTISRRLVEKDGTYFETSAEIHPGNSGGPLVNEFGQVIGVNTAIFGKKIKGIIIGETIKLAIPINTVMSYLSDLENGRNVVIPKTPEVVEVAPTPGPTPPPPVIEQPTAPPSDISNQVGSYISNKYAEFKGWVNAYESCMAKYDPIIKPLQDQQTSLNAEEQKLINDAGGYDKWAYKVLTNTEFSKTWNDLSSKSTSIGHEITNQMWLKEQECTPYYNLAMGKAPYDGINPSSFNQVVQQISTPQQSYNYFSCTTGPLSRTSWVTQCSDNTTCQTTCGRSSCETFCH